MDIEDTAQWIDGRVILVTGSAGSIGSEICRQLLQFAPQRIVLLDRAETGQFFLERELRPLAGERQIDVCIADVLDEPRMRRVLMQHRPHVIFHAAAYKHVPLDGTAIRRKRCGTSWRPPAGWPTWPWNTTPTRW